MLHGALYKDKLKTVFYGFKKIYKKIWKYPIMYLTIIQIFNTKFFIFWPVQKRKF